MRLMLNQPKRKKKKTVRHALDHRKAPARLTKNATTTALVKRPSDGSVGAADVVLPQHRPLYLTPFIIAATSKTDPLKLP